MDVSDSSTVLTAAAVAICVILYLYTAICFHRIARNLGVGRAWFAWIPILNIYLWSRICGKGLLWTILFFIPVVGVFIYLFLCVKLSHACGRGTLLGLLFIFPVLNLFILWAFVRSSGVTGANEAGSL